MKRKSESQSKEDSFIKNKVDYNTLDQDSSSYTLSIPKPEIFISSD